MAKFRVNKPNFFRDCDVHDPEKLMWSVLKRHFPFLLLAVERDKTLIDDINQSAQLAFYATGGKFKPFWNFCQRELYALAKALGFRRLRENRWIVKEFDTYDEEGNEIENKKKYQH
jgi:hypothetical protein